MRGGKGGVGYPIVSSLSNEGRGLHTTFGGAFENQTAKDGMSFPSGRHLL